MNRYHADPKEHWNPLHPVVLTPREFETQVLEWVSETPGLSQMEAVQQAKVTGDGGQYSIDILLRLTVLAGATILVLIECKHPKRRVERDEVIVLEGKLRDTAAHKGIIFSPSGFQKGALQYARSKGIATVVFISGDWLYETKALGPPPPPPAFLGLPKFAADIVVPSDTGVAVSTILKGYLDAASSLFNEDRERGDITTVRGA